MITGKKGGGVLGTTTRLIQLRMIRAGELRPRRVQHC